MTTRRNFLSAIAAGFSAAVLPSGVIMPVRKVWTPEVREPMLEFASGLAAGPDHNAFGVALTGDVLTVQSISSGTIRPGMRIQMAGVKPLMIVGQFAGSPGSLGTYRVRYT